MFFLNSSLLSCFLLIKKSGHLNCVVVTPEFLRIFAISFPFTAICLTLFLLLLFATSLLSLPCFSFDAKFVNSLNFFNDSISQISNVYLVFFEYGFFLLSYSSKEPIMPNLSNAIWNCFAKFLLFIPNATLELETYPSASKKPEINCASMLSGDINTIGGITH